MYLRLVYVSQAAPGLDARASYDIIRVAINRNSQLGLTGALLYLDGYFVQLLEGQPHPVKARFDRIAQDARHHHVALRLALPTPELLFPRDWMALRDAQQMPPGVKQAFGYQPGLPEARFSAEAIVNFVLASCGRAPLHSPGQAHQPAG